MPIIIHAIMWLTMFDVFATWYSVLAGICDERNAFMAWLFKKSIGWTVTGVLIVTLVIAILAAGHDHIVTRQLLWIMLFTKILPAYFHLHWIILTYTR